MSDAFGIFCYAVPHNNRYTLLLEHTVFISHYNIEMATYLGYTFQRNYFIASYYALFYTFISEYDCISLQ
jgi:hypothetical protein